ncbi:hypothetical protein [Haloarcula argentinensis]|uniref:DUF8076 domain-containing protein n=1 Tax=Haloarcula argentinensis TaxID=43776 RepID=A0A830FXK4_HALAR|nr:hypothetical protein [Haloarcula argentinensis]GGM52752.1 hypothetical protein GCM10009006_37350 [Haloarcula argentinensis]
MAGPGQIPGRYNLIIKGEYDGFDHQIPVEEFLQRLKSDDVPNKVSVVGLAGAFQDGDLAVNLAQEMDSRANDLEYQSPTIQFIVDGSFHRSGKTYDLRDGDELHSLQEVFGPQLERKEGGDWLVAPF